MQDDVATAPSFEVFSRQGCHLCEQLLEELQALIRDSVGLVVRDVDARADWRAEYGARVPVVCYDNVEICQYTLDRAAVLRIVRGR